MNIATRFVLELQEMSLLSARAARGLFKKPHYVPETFAQMDSIGVGSMTIIILTGFFTGGVLTLQTYQTLASYGATDQLGYLVAISLVRELGPVLTALMVTGRVVSAISAELGSMVVSQQIDAHSFGRATTINQNCQQCADNERSGREQQHGSERSILDW